MSSGATNAHDAAKAASRETVRDILGTLSMMRDEFYDAAEKISAAGDREEYIRWSSRGYAIHCAMARIRRDFKHE